MWKRWPDEIIAHEQEDEDGSTNPSRIKRRPLQFRDGRRGRQVVGSLLTFLQTTACRANRIWEWIGTAGTLGWEWTVCCGPGIWSNSASRSNIWRVWGGHFVSYGTGRVGEGRGGGEEKIKTKVKQQTKTGLHFSVKIMDYTRYGGWQQY